MQEAEALECVRAQGVHMRAQGEALYAAAPRGPRTVADAGRDVVGRHRGRGGKHTHSRTRALTVRSLAEGEC